MMEEKKLCRKCLLADMEETDYLLHLKAYIAAYPPEKRVADSVYKARLEQCRSCEHLYQGMCRKCGCFVELRALKPHMDCPAVPPKWMTVQEAEIGKEVEIKNGLEETVSKGNHIQL